MARSLALVVIVLIGACAAPAGQAPRLTPRAAEAIDPRVPVVHPADVRPASAATAARLAELVGQARARDSAFQAAIAHAERLASAAGARQSESWIAAQQALSAAVAARGPTTRALGDIDALATTTVAQHGGIPAGDFAAIQTALAEVGAIDRRQAAAIDRLQARLGS